MSEFDFTVPEIDGSVYPEDLESLPVIIYHGKVEGSKKWGIWSCDADNFMAPPDGWEATELQYGNNPNAPFVSSYVTHRLRFCPIAWRRRWILDYENGDTRYVPWFTKKGERGTPSKMTGQVQVLAYLPDQPNLFMVALKGMTKNICWDNDPSNSRFFRDKYPIGVLQRLTDYAHTATVHAQGKNPKAPELPYLCFWWADLVPATFEDPKDKKVKAVAIDTGHGTFVNPFETDMAVSDKLGLKTRYVGQERYKEFEKARADIGIDWEKEWGIEAEPTHATDEDEVGDDWPGGDEDEIPPEVNLEDEFPF